MRGTKRRVTFEVERGQLVRHVWRADDRSYTQRASLEALKEVALFIDAREETGVTTGQLWDAFPAIGATQLSVALDFLKERGCIETRGRRNFPASKFLYEDALIEFHALEA